MKIEYILKRLERAGWSYSFSMQSGAFFIKKGLETRRFESINQCYDRFLRNPKAWKGC